MTMRLYELFVLAYPRISLIRRWQTPENMSLSPNFQNLSKCFLEVRTKIGKEIKKAVEYTIAIG
jgi:hypothetical protein